MQELCSCRQPTKSHSFLEKQLQNQSHRIQTEILSVHQKTNIYAAFEIWIFSKNIQFQIKKIMKNWNFRNIENPPRLVMTWYNFRSDPIKFKGTNLCQRETSLVLKLFFYKADKWLLLSAASHTFRWCHLRTITFQCKYGFGMLWQSICGLCQGGVGGLKMPRCPLLKRFHLTTYMKVSTQAKGYSIWKGSAGDVWRRLSGPSRGDFFTFLGVPSKDIRKNLGPPRGSFGKATWTIPYPTISFFKGYPAVIFLMLK